MTLLGKILLFFNLLAAGGFVYLATQDWQGRQNINAAALRHILLLTGLPLGSEPGAPSTVPADPEAAVPFRIVMSGGTPTTDVSPKFLTTYFSNNAGGATPLGTGPVPNQLAEVKRVKGETDQQLQAAASTADKLALLRKWLLLQAETYEEREAILALLKAENVDELQQRLAARFDAVIQPPKPSDAEAATKLPAADPEDLEQLKNKAAQINASRAIPQDEEERRIKIAHLLVHLDTDGAWQTRVRAIIGIRQYVSTISAQSERFSAMVEYVETQIPADQVGYLADERTQLRLAISRTTLAEQQAKIRLKWEEQKKKVDDFVAQRTTELNAIKAQLRKVKAEVDELLVRQAGIETALFEVQREVAITLDEVYKLELQLEARERDLLGLPPKPKGN